MKDVEEMEVEEEIEIIEKEDITKDQEKEIAELKDRLHRNLAEFDNFRKRSTKEKTQMFDEGVKDTVEKILPILDNFELALKNLDENESFAKGIFMIYAQFNASLENIGLTAIDCIGQTFDPNYHQAVSKIEDENYKEQEIIQELQKGYIYKDRVLRHSMVIVAN